MRLAGAYLSIVLIWSTTPLALKWSTEVGFMLALLLRLAVALFFAAPLLAVMRGRLPWDGRARMLYLAGGVTTFSMLMLSNWSAQFIPSGWLSVAFGLTPIITSVMATAFLDEPAATRGGLVSLMLSLLGLGVIFGRGAPPGSEMGHGIATLLVAVFCYSGSLIWIKRINAEVDAISSMAGTTAVALLLALMSWLALGAKLPASFAPRAIGAIAYLGMVASVLGFSLFYLLLRHMDTTRIALISLITPVTALLIGHFLNGEPLNHAIWTGTALVLAGLIWFQFGSRIAGGVTHRTGRPSPGAAASETTGPQAALPIE